MMLIAIAVLFAAMVVGLAFSPTLGKTQSAAVSPEAQIFIESASVNIGLCDLTIDRPYSFFNSLLQQQCDYNLKFLKGLCEPINKAYDYCTDTKMDSYLIVRGQIDAPRPNDVWCNDFIDKCTELNEAAKDSIIEQFGEDSNGGADMIAIYDEQIEKLEEKRAAQKEQGDDD